MLITMSEMLTIAKENKFAVGAYNISDANIFKAVVEKAEELEAPAIITISNARWIRIRFGYLSMCH